MKNNILIVNDKPEMILLLSTLIKELTAYEPLITNNPFEAAEIIENEGPDIVIAEFKMPGLNGNSLLETVKGMDKDIQVIILSDYGDVETARDAMQKGAFDFIVKPCRKEHILFAIGNALRLCRLKKENGTLKKQLKILASEAIPYGARSSSSDI